MSGNVSANSRTMHSRLVLADPPAPGGAVRILGLLELEAPNAKKNEILRDAHSAAPV